MITIYELSAGTLLILNKAVRWAAAGLFFIAAMGIAIIHAGWVGSWVSTARVGWNTACV